MKDIQVRLMRAGVSGKDAWTPVIAIAPDGFRLVMQITNWVGGEGEKPVTGLYIGPSGYVDEIAKAVDVRGVGQKGWSPVLSVIPDGERRVLQVFDWTGGEGEKPATGLYIGLNGLVDDISVAMDIRGAQGIQGRQGEKGDTGNMGPIGPIPDHKWAGTSLAFQKVDGTYETPVNLIGPQGAQGIQGQQGIQGATGSPTTPDSITNEFLANIPANTIKGRLATDGDPQDLTADEAWQILGQDANKLLQRIEVAANISAIIISIPSDTKILQITGAYTLTTNASVYNGILLRFSTNGGVSYLSGPSDYFMSSYQVRSGAIVVGSSDGPNMAVSARAAVPHVSTIFTSHIALAPAGTFPAMKSEASALDSAGDGQYQFFGAGFCRTSARVTNLMLVPADGSFIQSGSLFVFEGDRA